MTETSRDSTAATAPASVVRRRRKWLRRFTGLFVVLLVGWLGSSALVTWQLTRRMTPIAEPPPLVAGLDIRSDRVRTSDGQDLGAWFCPGNPDTSTVLLVHGYTSARREWAPVFIARVLADIGTVRSPTRPAAGQDESGPPR